jgi:hypothetical protein
MGKTVEDAVTTLRNVERGTYRLWVRTRDWTHETGHSAGRFQIVIDGKAVNREFGTQNGEWAWEDGGLVELGRSEVELRLRDLTGFDGRCDCLWFSPDPDARPPHETEALLQFRLTMLGWDAEPVDGGNFDLVVVGAGVAGICAAVGAARLGLKVALVESRDVLGGNNTSLVRVHISADLNMEPWPELGNLTGEMRAAKHLTRPWKTDDFLSADREKRQLVEKEENIQLFTRHHLEAVEKSGDTIRSVVLLSLADGRLKRLSAPLFCDATGDGDLAVAAGCGFHIGRESRDTYGEARAPEHGDAQVLGSTLHWFSRENPETFNFPETPWALPINDATVWPTEKSAWNWEAGYFHDNAAQGEAVRDLLLRSIYGNWAYLKHNPERRERFRSLELQWCSHTLGKRESRRILGDVVLSQKDIPAKADHFPDAVVPCTWGIDVHVPQERYIKHLGKQAFKSHALHNDRGQTYAVMPYRSLYARDVTNCFLAGRCASMSHLAHAMFRCQGTTGMMGEAVALAAVVATGQNCTTAEVYTRHWEKMKQRLKQGL